MMMGLGSFRRSMELVEKHRKPNQRGRCTIQTNGVLIDEKWAAFFEEDNSLVGLSVDGPKGLHDRYRVDRRSPAMHRLDPHQRRQPKCNTVPMPRPLQNPTPTPLRASEKPPGRPSGRRCLEAATANG